MYQVKRKTIRKRKKFILLTALFTAFFKTGTLYFYFVLCPANYVAGLYVDILCEKTLLLFLK